MGMKKNKKNTAR